MHNTELYVEGRDTAVDPDCDDGSYVPFNVHESIFDKIGTDERYRNQLLSETFACLATFDRDIARNPAVASLTFLIITPFEFFPCVQVEQTDGRVIYYVHAGSVGWERLTGDTVIDHPTGKTLVEFVNDTLDN